MLSTQYQLSFYKKPNAEASCPYSLISTLWRASEAPEERVPVGSGLLCSPACHLDRTIHPIHTHRSPSICLLLLPTTAQECLAAGQIKAAVQCVRKCVCVQEREIPFPRGVYINNMNTPLHMSSYVTLIMTIYIYIWPHKNFSHARMS